MSKTYLCDKCRDEYETDTEPNRVGLQDLHEYPEGAPVPDIALFICDECHQRLAQEKSKQMKGTV